MKPYIPLKNNYICYIVNNYIVLPYNYFFSMYLGSQFVWIYYMSSMSGYMTALNQMMGHIISA